MITSNHIHLIVMNNETNKHKNVIPKSMQLIAGRTAQEYNQRKERKGAFWEDRYHCTQIDSGLYLNQCMTYIDMNMVRPGVVNHPMDWPHCGYHELTTCKKRFTILDIQNLLDLFSFRNVDELIGFRRFAIEKAIRMKQYFIRDEKWTECVAVGSRIFLEKIKKENLVKSRGREIKQKDNSFILKETQAPYKSNFAPKKPL